MKLKARQAKQAHRNLALLILIFLAVHFATHFMSLAGVEAHARTLAAGRLLYQFPLFEIALVIALAAQVGLGFKLLGSIRKRKAKGLWHWVQFISAAYLAYFIVMHTAAALITRLYVGLDTNFYWAAGTLGLNPIRYGFTPYYILAVTAVFSHVIAAFHFRGPRKWQAPALAVGPLVGTAFVLGYGGAFHTVEMPQEYLDFYSVFPGVAG
ncbi:MAG: hypothetical protein QNJ15_08605 [Erythrobacter sp.]|nr:hypothetical protein [Erythrobacter sp.]